MTAAELRSRVVRFYPVLAEIASGSGPCWSRRSTLLVFPPALFVVRTRVYTVQIQIADDRWERAKTVGRAETLGNDDAVALERRQRQGRGGDRRRRHQAVVEQDGDAVSAGGVPWSRLREEFLTGMLCRLCVDRDRFNVPEWRQVMIELFVRGDIAGVRPVLITCSDTPSKYPSQSGLRQYRQFRVQPVLHHTDRKGSCCR